MVLQRNNRWVALGQIQAGLSNQQIANRFDVHRSTISRLHQRFGTTGTVNDRRRPGQRRVTTTRQDFNIRTLPIDLGHQQKLLELFQDAEIRRSLLEPIDDV
jgi:IS30 family transposase